MTTRTGPPTEVGPRPGRPSRTEATDTQHTSPPQADTPESTGREQQQVRYAVAWRHGFAYGFRDAVRLAHRRLGPEARRALSQLAEEYDLAPADD